MVFVDGIQRQPVGIEQLADVLAGLEHDLVEVLGIVDTRGDVVQLLVEQGLEGDAAFVRRQLLALEKRLLGRFVALGGFEHGTHNSNSWPARSHRMSCVTLGPDMEVSSNFWISAMIRSVSAGLVWVM